MIGIWIVAVEILQKVRAEFLKLDTEGLGGENVGVVYEDENEMKEWMGEHCERVYIDWQL